MKRNFMYSSIVIAMIALWGITPDRGVFIERQGGFPQIVPALSFTESDDGVQLDVPYVPTPHEVVRTMLSMAGVTRNDVLYDLGCGDGRIVVTAAQKYGTRGTGVDIDPERIKESNDNARKAGVTDKVRFIQKSLFDVDLRDASVVTLYLLSSVNLQLRPKLLRELKPGTRVVSHDFDMDDWKPDHKTDVEGHTVYYWVIPANVSGTWTWTAERGGKPYTLRLTQRFQNVTGTLESGGARVKLSDVQLKGDTLRFTINDTVQGMKTPARFTAKVNGDRIAGDLRSGEGTKAAWSARRDAGTMAPLDEKDSGPVQANVPGRGERTAPVVFH